MSESIGPAVRLAPPSAPAKDAPVAVKEQQPSSLPAASGQCRELLSTVCHDLRAPLVNLAGFTAELEADVAQLENILQTVDQRLPEGTRVMLENCLGGDLRGSLRFIKTSAELALERLNRLDDLS